ncbi:hypothetical protein PPACK8108_LOCUS5667 [Phakopsora pachyrhizi]|uniref:Uncharacterized protein n=1 Tax=Phakopsora pachyrhizi TaxID=170000 RepID=A0AAV0AR67_PHAPC|nr:hypothetical protein PPACK8108_LOCUS5667 [Phakopsora pachyrhizi]
MTTSSVILHPEIDQARSDLLISTCFVSAMVGNQSGRESNLIAGVFTRNQSQEPQTNEMDRIIKEKALKCEEERQWLTSKLVKLTSSNKVLEREHSLYATEV